MGILDKYGVATHELNYIKALMARGKVDITRSARKGAVSQGYATDEEIIERVLCITEGEIYKTMPSAANPNLWQDVYKSYEADGSRLYIKLQISNLGDSVVISFKLSEEI